MHAKNVRQSARHRTTERREGIRCDKCRQCSKCRQCHKTRQCPRRTDNATSADNLQGHNTLQEQMDHAQALGALAYLTSPPSPRGTAILASTCAGASKKEPCTRTRRIAGGGERGEPSGKGQQGGRGRTEEAQRGKGSELPRLIARHHSSVVGGTAGASLVPCNGAALLT